MNNSNFLFAGNKINYFYFSLFRFFLQDHQNSELKMSEVFTITKRKTKLTKFNQLNINR